MPGLQTGAHLVGCVGIALAGRAGDDDPRRCHPDDPGQAEDLPPAHLPRLRRVPAGPSLESALDVCRSGDLWLFRGSTAADRAIQLSTNSPVNHVGMAVVLDDLPPLMWHAELGRSLPDVWSGAHQRGVQLHDLGDAVRQWVHRYGQRAWLRQLDQPVTVEMEDALLRTIARLDGTPFPSTAALAGRWVRGRGRRSAAAETTYGAEVVAATYAAMGLLDDRRPTNYYDPGMFWSGDD